MVPLPGLEHLSLHVQRHLSSWLAVLDSHLVGPRPPFLPRPLDLGSLAGGLPFFPFFGEPTIPRTLPFHSPEPPQGGCGIFP